MKVIVVVDENVEIPEITLRTNEMNESLDNILKMIKTNQFNFSDKILVKDKDNVNMVSVVDILFIETVEGAIFIHTKDDIFRMSESLANIEKQLPNNFVRISRSGIANVRNVSEIKKNIKGSSIMKFFESPKQTVVSRRAFKTVKSQLLINALNKQEEQE